MAKQPIDTIKQWFMTGDYPAQQQFWDWLDSFIHRDDLLAINNITDLATILQSKADASALNALINTVLLAPGATSWIVPAGTMIEMFWVMEPTHITFTAGTTVGGTDIIEGEQFTGDLVYTKNKPFSAQTTIYFGGVTANTIIKIFKR